MLASRHAARLLSMSRVGEESKVSRSPNRVYDGVARDW